ncbi:MAG: hypothetical protein JRI97_04580 [Deltaproteobacteria bacterium]|nr:hypothetical protein [Deltaproteobacteria bacterium]
MGTAEALEHLRDPSRFKWYIIVSLLVVLYIAFDEIARGNLKVVLAACAFLLMDVFNEIWNALYYTATGYAAVWQVNMPTAYQPLIGWNIEIIFMFFLCGIAGTKLLPRDKEARFGWLNNRHVFAIVLSALSVGVEIILHAMGALTWNYPWWQAEFPFVLFIIGYMPFYEILYLVYDLPTVKDQLKVVLPMAGILVPAFVILLAAGLI